MNVYDNVAFGLKIKKEPKDVIEQKVKRMLLILKDNFFVLHHHTVNDIALSDKTGYKLIGRLIINVGRRSNLLDFPILQH